MTPCKGCQGDRCRACVNPKQYRPDPLFIFVCSLVLYLGYSLISKAMGW